MLLSFMMQYALTKQIHIKYFSNITAATASRESFTISKSINSTNTTANLTAVNLLNNTPYKLENA